jgi:2-polyprenyl-3-methyl-5-hydroxy-6-metoxy-1,4-benzoquinol methylase
MQVRYPLKNMMHKEEKTIARSYDKIAEEYVREHEYGEHLALSSLKLFSSYLKSGARVLDVGCGGGRDSKFLNECGFQVLGIDVSRKMIFLAKKYSRDARFEVADVFKIGTRKKYHGIWCCRVFHHISLKDQDAFLSKLSALLKPNGILYITSVVSDRREDYEAFDSGNEKLLKKRLTSKSFKKLMEKHGFKTMNFKYWVGKKGMEIIAEKE